VTNRDIVVIGASSGGVEALSSLVSQLPADLPAAVFIVLHTLPEAHSLLPAILSRAGPLPAHKADEPDKIEHGHIYVAPPDHHLIVKQGFVRVTRGPHENRTRPAIDPLFRSAAVSYGTRVIGVVLTGYLNDGSSGLLAIKSCGGMAIVQDPQEAQAPDMPRNALAKAPIDYVLPLEKMGETLRQLVRTPAPDPVPIPRDIVLEARIAETGISTIPMTEELGTLSPLSCPECGGPLWKMDQDEVQRYRCHVGHGYTAQYLLGAQDHALESALWEAVRAMEQQAALLTSLTHEERSVGREKTAHMYEERSLQATQHASVLRQHLLDRQDLPDKL
jgi:two-component system, chemotaxis family, protein-glutamate methylesterase/glutaminase